MLANVEVPHDLLKAVASGNALGWLHSSANSAKPVRFIQLQLPYSWTEVTWVVSSGVRSCVREDVVTALMAENKKSLKLFTPSSLRPKTSQRTAGRNGDFILQKSNRFQLCFVSSAALSKDLTRNMNENQSQVSCASPCNVVGTQPQKWSSAWRCSSHGRGSDGSGAHPKPFTLLF